MPLIVGSDVSHYQTLADIDAAVRGGSRYIIVKASEGASGDNPGGLGAHDAQVAEARRLGVIVGHYHFAIRADRAVVEAANFLAHAKALPGDLVALDMESGGMDPSWSARAAYALTWLRTVADQTGALPLLYVNKSWWAGLRAAQPALASYPLWIATAGTAAGQPGVSGWELQQWSTAGGIDHDVANTDLTAYAIPGDTMPALDQTDYEQIARYTRTGLWDQATAGTPTLDAKLDAILAAVAKPLDPAVVTAAVVSALAAHPVTAAIDPAAIGAALGTYLAQHPLVPKP